MILARAHDRNGATPPSTPCGPHIRHASRRQPRSAIRESSWGHHDYQMRSTLHCRMPRMLGRWDAPDRKGTMTSTATSTSAQPPLDPPSYATGVAVDTDADMSPRELIRVLLVDDHPAVRLGVKRVLDDEYDMVLVAGTATACEALAVADISPIHVAIVDYELAGQNGLTLARSLSELGLAPRILIYTDYADATMTIAAIVAGADGLLSKASFGDELCHVVRALADGRRHFPTIARPVADGVLARLEPREQSITGMLIQGLDSATIEQTLDIDATELDARRWAILRALTAQPSSDLGLPAPKHTLLDYDRLLRQPAKPLREVFRRH
jgi:DNA-binding NarL/FixJ family response regulator